MINKDGRVVMDPQILKMLEEMREEMKELPPNTSVFQQRLAHAIAHQTGDKERLMALFERMCDANMRVVEEQPQDFCKGKMDG